MTTTLQQLLAAHPEAVYDINSTWPTKLDPKSVDTTSAIIREHAVKLGVASYAEACLDSVASLLSAIEAKLKAERGLSDAEIEGMKWRRNDEAVFYGKGDDRSLWFECETHTDARGCIAAQHACVDRLWQDIRRLREKCGEAADAK